MLPRGALAIARLGRTLLEVVGKPLCRSSPALAINTPDTSKEQSGQSINVSRVALRLRTISRHIGGFRKVLRHIRDASSSLQPVGSPLRVFILLAAADVHNSADGPSHLAANDSVALRSVTPARVPFTRGGLASQGA